MIHYSIYYTNRMIFQLLFMWVYWQEKSEERKVVTGEQSWQKAWKQMLPYVNHEAINMWVFLAGATFTG